MIKASGKGHLGVVQYLVDQLEVNVRCVDQALIKASEKGHLGVATYLVECGATINPKSGSDLLINAARNGNCGIVQFLVGECNVDVNARNRYEETVLMTAAAYGHVNVVRYLDVNARDGKGDTALMLAVKGGYVNIVRCLAESRYSIVNVKYYKGTTALMWAVEMGHYEIVRVLVEKHGADLNIADNEGNTALMKAVMRKRIDLVQYLVSRNANVDAINNRGETAFRLAYNYGYQTIQRIFVPFLSLNPLRAGSATDKATSSSGKFCCLIPPSEVALIDQCQDGNIVGKEYRAKWLDADVVVKLYIPDASFLTFEEEVYLWQKLRHPNVIKMYGACTAGSRLHVYCGPDCPPGDAHNLALRMCCQDPNDRPSLFSVVYELERLSVESASGSEAENLIAFDGYKIDKMNEVWRKVQGYMETCDDEEYCRVFDELTSVHKNLKSSTHQTLLAKFYALLTEFYQIIKMSPEEARIVRLSSSRATTTSFYALHWRIESLLKTLQGSTDTLTWRNEQWQQQRDDQTKCFVSGVSDMYLLLKDLKTVEERSAFLNVLRTEMENFQSKYTADQLKTMKTTYDTIVSKVGTDDLLSLTPEWFIPWYELIIDEWSELGKGGFGSVCRGKWLDSDVVVKQVLLIGDSQDSSDFSYHSLSADPTATPVSNTKRVEALGMFRHEVEIWFGLSHPHVIRLFGACHVGRPFFVCEYATNGTMIDYLRKCPDQLWTVLLGAALGVQYLHARGVVHGDLKGNNIVIGSDKKAKVTDFGLSSIAKNENDTPQVSAALNWVAPECFSGSNGNSPTQAKTGPTFASDVYSLGMCIVEALRVVENVKVVKRTRDPHQSCLPWGSFNNLSVKYHATRGVLPRRPTICKNGPWDLVKRMCVFKPQKRIKISTVVDELMILVAGTDQHVDCSSKVHGWRQKLTKIPIIRRQSVDLKVRLDSVSITVTKAKKKLAKWRNMIIRSGLEFSLYSSLWEQFEHVDGQIDDSHSAKCQTMYCSLVVEAYEATSRLKNASSDKGFLTESTMRCYELGRRLEKFCEAYFLVFKP
ncbi:Serine/threonine protein Kinase [Phytophthora palmivora]|uniref:Serine/threonine protein Kinase n=1 Tax=Phytophthora palmivora TaxID=4796 RepID=A0A2P4Y0K3_9STRA|nr:Serine/threonine protein Kinase [Phytophthora palmivora]